MQKQVSSILSEKHINKLIRAFKDEINPSARNASFDYCYNYFQDTPNPASNKHLQISCLQLGLYLASWGMYRGSSFLLKEKSIKYYKPLIRKIAKFKKLQGIDVDGYTNENIEEIIKCYKSIAKWVPKEKRAITLVTKIMLGIFGCIPAFDDYFCESFRKLHKKNRCGFRRVNKHSLSLIKQFYDDHRDLIDRWSKKIKTIDFNTGKKTRRTYTKAKIIDMIGFQEGLQCVIKKKKNMKKKIK